MKVYKNWECDYNWKGTHKYMHMYYVCMFMPYKKLFLCPDVEDPYLRTQMYVGACVYVLQQPPPPLRAQKTPSGQKHTHTPSCHPAWQWHRKHFATKLLFFSKTKINTSATTQRKSKLSFFFSNMRTNTKMATVCCITMPVLRMNLKQVNFVLLLV